MIEPLVSIVLPVYNVEPYLNRCMETIVGQTYTNLEIIMVDDGSPDGCPALCDEWAVKDHRIKVIHKQNAGLGMARNSGIEAATGDYVFFIDSDDYVNVHLVELCVKQAQETGAELIHYGHHCITASGVVSPPFHYHGKQTLFCGEEMVEIFFKNTLGPATKSKRNRTVFASAWSYMYSMDLIRRINWKFVSERDIISEDIYSHLILFKHVSSVSIVKESLYYYCKHLTSLSRAYCKDRYARIRHFYLESIKLCQQLGYSQKVIERLANPYFSNTIAAIKQIATADISRKERYSLVKEIVCDKTLQTLLKQWRPGGVSRKLTHIFIPLIRMRLVRLCCLACKLEAKRQEASRLY